MSYDCLTQGDDIVRSWTSSLACRALERRIAHTGTSSDFERQWTLTTETIYAWMGRRHDVTVRVLLCLLFMESRPSYLNSTLEKNAFFTQVHHQVHRLCLDAQSVSTSKEVKFIASLMVKVAKGEVPCLMEVLDLALQTDTRGSQLPIAPGMCDYNSTETVDRWRKRCREDSKKQDLSQSGRQYMTADNWFVSSEFGSGMYESVLRKREVLEVTSEPFAVVPFEERLRKSFKQDESRQHSCFTAQTNQGIIAEPEWNQWDSESPSSSTDEEEALAEAAIEKNDSPQVSSKEVEVSALKEEVHTVKDEVPVSISKKECDTSPSLHRDHEMVPQVSKRRSSRLPIVKLDGAPAKTKEEMRQLLMETWTNLTPILRQAFMIAVEPAAHVVSSSTEEGQ